MVNLILFGPPGAGKGTQAERLAAHYGLKHISTGAVFRYNIDNKTQLGSLAKRYMDKGQLVPDNVTIDMFKEEVKKSARVWGFVFDGFPRTRVQADALDDFLAARGTAILKVLLLEVPDSDLVVRLLKRGEESGRTDDADEQLIRDRIAEYHAKTAPLIEYYQNRSKLEPVDGVGSIDAINARLVKLVDKTL